MFNKNEPKYQALLRRLQQMGDRKVLTVYVADTGELAGNSHPMRVAVQELQDLLLPVIFLQELPGEIAPINSLAAKINPPTHRFWPLSTGGFIGEIILNSGNKTHIERMGNLLAALSEDGAKPDEILLVGEKQGALICHEIGSKVYVQFGHDIQLHFLENSAPEPFQEYEIYEKIIPPNTVTFTAFYAAAASNLSRLIFINATTPITTFITPSIEAMSLEDASAIQQTCSYFINAVYGSHGMEKIYHPSLSCTANAKPASAIHKGHSLFKENDQPQETSEAVIFTCP